jgi:hypothetical protein
VRSKVKGVELSRWLCSCAYSRAVWWRSVESHCEGGMVPLVVMQGKDCGCGDRIRTEVRHVLVQEVLGTCPMSGGVMVMV